MPRANRWRHGLSVPSEPRRRSPHSPGRSCVRRSAFWRNRQRGHHLPFPRRGESDAPPDLWHVLRLASGRFRCSSAEPARQVADAELDSERAMPAFAPAVERERQLGRRLVLLARAPTRATAASCREVHHMTSTCPWTVFRRLRASSELSLRSLSTGGSLRTSTTSQVPSARAVSSRRRLPSAEAERAR